MLSTPSGKDSSDSTPSGQSPFESFGAGRPRPRLFCESLSDLADSCRLEADESHHARRVLRLEVGASVELIDGRGSLALANIVGFEANQALCRVLQRSVVRRDGPQLTIASAIPKGTRADHMVDQLSQLGADQLIPLQTARSVVSPRPGRIDRFRRRALESIKQSRRAIAMTIAAPRHVQEVLAEPADLRLILQPGGDRPSIDLAGVSRIVALVGPEGGWTNEETAAAADAGFVAWTVGPYILRVETAAAAAVAVLRCRK